MTSSTVSTESSLSLKIRKDDLKIFWIKVAAI